MHRSNFHGEAELLGAFLTRFQGGESMSRILPLVAGIVSLGLLVSACGGDSESGSENPSASSPSSASTTPGETGATPSEPEIVEVVPEPVVLTADDLVTGMPTNKQMSMVQGFRFVENDDWVGEDDEGPEWANNAPLTKEQRSMLGLGQVRRVMPEQCMLVSMGAGNGLSQMRSLPRHTHIEQMITGTLKITWFGHGKRSHMFSPQDSPPFGSITSRIFS